MARNPLTNPDAGELRSVRRLAEGSTLTLCAKELQSDPPPRLTKRGLAMLEEIWIAAGRPAKPRRNKDGDGTARDVGWVEIDELASHQGPDAKRRAAGQIRDHLLAGGYLHMELFQTDEETTLTEISGTIEELGLSTKAYDALIEAACCNL
jgi:hypothetical protein